MYVCSRQLILQVFPSESCPPPMLLALLHRDASSGNRRAIFVVPITAKAYSVGSAVTQNFRLPSYIIES
jgi:hypothetical protein